jgi:hypothetical protein
VLVGRGKKCYFFFEFVCIFSIGIGGLEKLCDSISIEHLGKIPRVWIVKRNIRI